MQAFRSFIPAVMGQGSVSALEGKIRELGLKKLLLVHDPFLKEAAEKVSAIIEGAGAQVVTYDGVCTDPTDISCMEGANALKAAGGVDGVVGLGGGSALDTAKCVNVLSTNPEPMYLYTTPGGRHKTNPGLPLILIPTTAGTGAECTFVAVVTWTQYGNNKISVISPNCCSACLAIIDPDMSKSMPPSVTVASGVDALTHACEAMTVANTNPVSDALSKEAIALVMKNLPEAVKKPDDIAARENMANAAMLAGQAFANTLVHMGHAFGHSFGAYFHKPHGLMVGAALPVILNYIAPACPDTLAAIGGCMGLSLAGESAEEIGAAVARRIYAFYGEIGFPSLAELGVKREDVANIVPYVKKDPCFRLACKSMPEEDILDYALRIYDRTL